jgi:protein-tyrosine phosphatase
MKKVLFLCTGNYYRSRFAEYLFNDLARKRELDWVADSRGLGLDRGIKTIGPISWFTAIELRLRGINLDNDERFPIQVQEEDFQTADIVIAVNETEHLPFIVERFAKWQHKIEYWLIGDSHRVFPPIALRQLEKKAEELIDQLAEN